MKMQGTQEEFENMEKVCPICHGEVVRWGTCYGWGIISDGKKSMMLVRREPNKIIHSSMCTNGHHSIAVPK